MFDATPILKLYARRRLAKLARTNSVEAQRKQLLKLVKHAANTSFGRQHGFDRIDSVETYQNRVPLRRYEDFWSGFWKQSFPDITGLTWPDRISYFRGQFGHDQRQHEIHSHHWRDAEIQSAGHS